jgi:hypothetical protein
MIDVYKHRPVIQKGIKMKNILLILILVSLPLAELAAATLDLKAKCSMSGESVEVDDDEVKSNGWTVTEDEYGEVNYTIDTSVDTSALPLDIYLGDLNVSVSKTGRLEVGMTIGDADAGADSSLQLPQKNGELLPIEALQWSVSGGDYASGAWGFSCYTEVSIKK